ncbi:CoA-binding protein [Demequina sp. TTPB684]|uniref:CoA-binding protein n=1 Tax=unclassified Demequina TaxID=2620311 RepID=UPI001CF34B55|nr:MULTISPECIES: CoA-binding protein [unclassified Demequina]MCB2412768.1 CoA-binding protein [Demequina sp. TTPB684]UPU87116.1 CoA-binding protein [Demequina sp. TMPB413]
MSSDEAIGGGGEACALPRVDQAPADDVLAAILARSQAVAVVGASPDPMRTSHAIATWLMNNTPYEVYLVNPFGGDADIEGHGFYSALSELPVAPDIVVVFRRSADVPPVADAAVEADASVLWLQLGIENAEAAASAGAAGLGVVQNRCIKIEYARLRDQIEAIQAT